MCTFFDFLKWNISAILLNEKFLQKIELFILNFKINNFGEKCTKFPKNYTLL